MREAIRRSLFLIICCGLPGFDGTCRGALLNFDYSAEVSFTTGKVFGATFEVTTPVVGQFAVDTTAKQSHDFGAGRIGYRQAIPGGLTAILGTAPDQLEVVANEYLVVIGNDIVGEEGFVFDTVEFLFDVELLPPLAAPLLVNGTPRQRGDYNEDGERNDLDYGQWKADFGVEGTHSDGNGDMIVDAADYTVWRDGGSGGFLLIVLRTLDRNRFSSASLVDADLAANLTLNDFYSPFNPLGIDSYWAQVFFGLTDLSLEPSAALSVPEPASLISIVTALLLVRRRPRPTLGHETSRSDFDEDRP